MKITLISLDQMIISYGLRIISSCLKKEGFDVEIIFARAIVGKPLDEEVENEITDKCLNSDLIGISLMSNHFLAAISLTERLKKGVGVPIVWGGVHPTFCPEESLQYVEIVCVGEGETSLVELAKSVRKKKINKKIKGFWFKEGEKIIKNSLQPLVDNLDLLPFPDFGPENHYIRDERQIKKLTNKLFEKYLTKREKTKGNYVSEYYISTSRGCPFRCAYCASNTIKNIYSGEKFYRLRSAKKVIEEVKILTSKYSFVKWIYFSDDDLLASPEKRIREFCLLWKKEINLPFYATLAPWSYDESKLKNFIKAGLETINMGIQTVSLNGGKVYHRIVPKKRLREIIASINQIGIKTPPIYDFILDNPFENDNDKLENLQFALEIPGPKKFQLFSLIPFPGTEIYELMKKRGLLTDESKAIYNKCYSYPQTNYLNMLMFLLNNQFPSKLIKLLSGPLMLAIFNNRISRKIFELIPYTAFLFLIRNFINIKFWKYNLAPKGEY